MNDIFLGRCAAVLALATDRALDKTEFKEFADLIV
jgi:hypothetical protein